MADPRGSTRNPIRVLEVENGDVPDNPINVDDYDWEGIYVDTDDEEDSESMTTESHGAGYQMSPGQNVSRAPSKGLESVDGCEHDQMSDKPTVKGFENMDSQNHPTGASHKHYRTKLPLDSFIGNLTLEKHAEIEPKSAEFRRDIIQRELEHRNQLKIQGRACAEEMMRILNEGTTDDSRDIGQDPDNRSN